MFINYNVIILKEELLIKYNIIVSIYLNNKNVNDLKKVWRIQYQFKKNKSILYYFF